MIRRTLRSLVPLLALAAPFGCADPPDQGRGEPVGEAAQALDAACGRRGCTSATVNLTIARPGQAASAVFDTELDQSAPNSANGTTSTTTATGPDGSGNQHDALFQFDLSALPSATSTPSLASLNASGVKIVSAYLTLTEGGAAPSGPATINVHAVTSSWTEAAASWNDAPTYDPTPATSFSNGYPQTIPSTLPNVSILSLVQGWASTPSTNDGILLESPAGSGLTTFYTSEDGDIYVQPELTLIYGLSCVAGFADCNDDEADGCEANLQTDPNNCSACGTVCPAGDVCQAGACVAPACPCAGTAAWTSALAGPAYDCGSPFGPGGVEESFDVGQGVAYAGPAFGGSPQCFAFDQHGNSVVMDNISATAVAACEAELGAACACPGGESLCDGACVTPAAFASDPKNCGACGDVCSAAPANAMVTCGGGVCGFSCDAGYADCGGACADVQSDPNNCGACGDVCPGAANAVPTCAAGRCGVACDAGYATCGGACADVQSDPNNCGACGSVCSGTTACSAGACTSAGCTDDPHQLVGWWTGVGNANDSSGDGNNGTVVGTVGFTPAGFSFSGEGYVALPSAVSIAGTGPFTVSATIQTTSSQGMILNQRSGAVFNGEYALAVGHTVAASSISAPGKICWTTYGDSAFGFDFCGNVSVDDGRPHSIIATREANGSGWIYVDGALDSTQAGPARTLAQTQVYIGEDVRDGVEPFDGVIGQVTINASACVPPPVLLASGQPFPLPIAIDATTVYWGNTGDHTVHSVPKGGGAGTLLSTVAAGPYFLAVGTSSLFWSEDNFIETVPKAGGPTTQLAVAQPAPRGIAADATNVYWANYFGNDILRCAQGGCGQAPSPFGTGQGTITVALDSNNVYWADQGNFIWACPKTGCPGGVATQLASGGYNAIATDGVNVYWAGQTTVSQVPVGGGATVVLASGLGLADGVATDGVDVYFTDVHFGIVYKCAVGGCGNAPTVVRAGLDNPNFVAVDTTSVYYTDTNNGNVWQQYK